MPNVSCKTYPYHNNVTIVQWSADWFCIRQVPGSNPGRVDFFIESINFNVRFFILQFCCVLFHKSPWSSGLHVTFTYDRSRVQIPAKQIFSIESINFNVRFLILQFCLWYFFFSFLRLCQPNLSLLYIPFLMSYCSTF